MPEENKKSGSCYMWVISSFLFLSILSGGTFLFLYITQPESSTTAWYPFLGISLVALPWFFWLLTFLYRIVSRAFGFRMVCFGAGDDVAGGGGVDVAARSGGGEGNVEAVSPRKVHFGAAVVIGEGGSSGGGGAEGSSSRSLNSNESEMPLKLSMGS